MLLQDGGDVKASVAVQVASAPQCKGYLLSNNQVFT